MKPRMILLSLFLALLVKGTWSLAPAPPTTTTSTRTRPLAVPKQKHHHHVPIIIRNDPPLESSVVQKTTQNVNREEWNEKTPSSLSIENDVGEDTSRRTFLAALVLSTSVGGLVAFEESAEAAATSAATAQTSTTTIDWQGILKKSSKRALGGGKAGAAAAVVQVCSLMWLRTSMNYQYRYGGNLQSSLQTLWSQGGISRLYQGLPFALIQGPLTRFGDTAANVGVLALLESFDATRTLPLPLKTACGSLAAGAWRIVLMPVDASKTALQVEGAEGLDRLRARIAEDGFGVLYRGAVAQAAATAAGHFPWFLTYNYLNEHLPTVVVEAATGDVTNQNALLLSLLRSAFLGLSASCVSDVVSNSLRVLKTTKQTAQLSSTDANADLSYPEIVKLIVEQDGVGGLLGRGLQTRLLTNAIQGAVFSVCWKYFQQMNGLQ